MSSSTSAPDTPNASPPRRPPLHPEGPPPTSPGSLPILSQQSCAPPSPSPSVPHPPAADVASLFGPRTLAQGGRDTDRAYLDAVERELLDEIQLVQTKLSESRHRSSMQKNRRTMRRNPSISDSLMSQGASGRHQSSGQHMPGENGTPIGLLRGDAAPDRTARPRIISVSFRLPKKEHRESVRQQLFDSALPPKAIFSLQAASDVPFVWVGAADGVTDTESASFENVYGEEHRVGWGSGSLRASDGSRRRRSRCVPVVLPEEADVLHNYAMFCEETLWSLLHYDYDPAGRSVELEEYWSAYRVVNQRFAEAVSEIYEDGDLIWVHNYHLMLLPSLLRESLWYAKIGFHLYTPFPSAEIFRILPQRTELLRGLLGADLIGFHSYDYSKQFVACCARLLGVDGTPDSVEADPRSGRKCELGIYPGGIDVTALKNHVSSKVVKSRVAELRARFEGRKIVVAVDRLDDCFAGISLKLLAFEKLLINHSELQGNVVLVQVAMIPRQAKSVTAFRAQQMEVNELVGRINSTFGTFAFSPVHYINTELAPTELHALMSVGHVCVVSNIRDGMGLVPHAWTVCQYVGYKGPLVLSEFAGTAHNFVTALHVNPWNVDEVATKIKVALDMSHAARNMRIEAAYRYVTKHTASLWGFNFLEDLEQAGGAQVESGAIGTPTLEIASVQHAYLGTSAAPSPISSSNVLSSLARGPVLPQTSSSSRLHHDKLASAMMNSYGTVPHVLAASPDLKNARMGNFPLLGDVVPRGNKSSSLERVDGSWMSPDASLRLKKRKKANLLILDLDGTLVPFQAISKLGAPTSEVVNLIRSLSQAYSRNHILIVSSRNRNTVMKWLGELDVFLAAEDGAFIRAPGASSWTSLFRDTSNPNHMLQRSKSGHISRSVDGASQFESNHDDELLGDGDQPHFDLQTNARPLSKTSSHPARLYACDEDDENTRSYASSDWHHRGSAQSIISLNNDARQHTDSAVLAWKKLVLPVMHHFAERTPGVVLEEGDASLTWHYTDADTDFGKWQARDLYKQLESFMSQRLSIDLAADEGRRRWVKVRPKGVDKSVAVVKVLEMIRRSKDNRMPQPHSMTRADDDPEQSIDFVLCIGDDRADECMFELFKDEKRLEREGVHCAANKIFTCRVGSSATSALWVLESPQRVVELLEALSIWRFPDP